MGGPNYATPQPVTQPSGKTIIWDWNKREFVPYTAPGAKSAGPPPPSGSGAPGDAAGAPESGAVAAPTPEPTGSRSEGHGFPLKPRRRAPGQSPTGTSLLTLLSDWGK